MAFALGLQREAMAEQNGLGKRAVTSETGEDSACRYVLRTVSYLVWPEPEGTQFVH